MPLPADVSVLLPVWNGERFLAEAVESVLRQTHESLELIVIDDGSSDGSLAIAEEFAARDSRVVVIHTPHRGLPSALNAGTAVARGRYVARMDADDVSLPTRLARQTEYLDANIDVVAVGSAVEVIDETGDFLGHKTFATDHEQITAALLVGLTPFSHPAT
ncbi:MAG TPA: glycosyltransferase family 2 protein, partial [Thermoanaerobaculia bacterium]